MKLRTRALGVLAAAAALSLTACSSGPAAPGGSDSGEQKSYKIGITQIVEHPALDAARDGFKQAFADAGIDASFDEQNAQGEIATANTIASTFKTGGFDLVLAIATPAAQAAAQTITDIPVLFTAVTDAEEAGLVKTNEKPGANVTGTSDLNPVAEQIELIKKINPEAKTVGFLYSSGEVNSEIQIKLAKAAAEKEGLKTVEKTVSNSAEVAQAAEALGDVDAIYVPTDNNVVSAISVVVAQAEKQGALLIGSEAGQVDQGAAATYGLNYTELGKQTGEMAIRILTKGEKPADMPVETLAKAELIVNPEAAKRMGFTIPKDMIDAADTVVK